MTLSTVHTLLEYDIVTPTHFCFHVQAARGGGQTVVAEELDISPAIDRHEFTDAATGNRFIRLDAPVGPFTLHYKADVQLHSVNVEDDLPEVPLSELPPEVFPYLLPSRYCEADAVFSIAQRLFCHTQPGLARVKAVVQWIHENIKYRVGSSDVTTSARDAIVNREGVCRDFAHLAVTFCRALSIPARFVAGYVWFDEPPQDFHAAFDVYLAGRWVTFDATGMAPPQRLVRIGVGEDAKDVAFATYFGDARLVRKEVNILEHEPRSGPGMGPEVLAMPAYVL
jgi:transglutaminase-like putative cysteine protease